jgi:hypothetical protein
MDLADVRCKYQVVKRHPAKVSEWIGRTQIDIFSLHVGQGLGFTRRMGLVSLLCLGQQSTRSGTFNPAYGSLRSTPSPLTAFVFIFIFFFFFFFFLTNSTRFPKTRHHQSRPGYQPLCHFVMAKNSQLPSPSHQIVVKIRLSVLNTATQFIPSYCYPYRPSSAIPSQLGTISK